MCGTFMMSLIAVSLGGANQVAGIVLDLRGIPLAGAVVRNRWESDTTNASGLWILGNASLRRRVSCPRLPAGTPTNRFAGKGLVLLAGGIAADGRRNGRPSPTITERPAAARMWAPNPTFDTLEILWKGSVRATIPLGASEASFLSVRIDTSFLDHPIDPTGIDGRFPSKAP